VLGGIGSKISLNYVPLKGSKRQPDPKADPTLYWIQRVTTNYPAEVGSVGNTISYIDNIRNKKNNFTPYYGSGNFLQPNGLFEDRPYRPSNITNLTRGYFGTAELYLAQSNPNKVQEVTIYNRVKWGGVYKYVPDKNPVPVPPPVPQPICPPPRGFFNNSGSVIIASSSSQLPTTLKRIRNAISTQRIRST